MSVSWLGSRRDSLNPVDELHPQDREEGTFRSDVLKLDWQNNFFLHPSHTLTAGLEVEEERGRSDYFYESAWGTSESSFPSARARSAGAYILDHWEVRDRFFVTAGVRTEDHSRSGAAVTFRVAPAYLVAVSGTRLKASFGTGFKSPSLYQLFAPATSWGPIGNPALRPERAAGWDAGIEQRFASGAVVIGLTWFANSFRDLVDFDYQAGYVNVGRARTRGLEASAEARPAAGVRFAASYTRLSARDLDAGTELMRRPRDRFAADLSFRFLRKYDLAVSGLWTGRRLRPRLQRFSLSGRRAPRLLPARRRPLDLSRLPARDLSSASRTPSAPATSRSGATARPAARSARACAWPSEPRPGY